MHNGTTIEDIMALVASKLPDLTLADQYRAEENDAAEEGATDDYEAGLEMSRNQHGSGGRYL